MSRSEDVPNSRLFILGGKGASEEEFRECFGKFGEIKDIWIVKDRRTNEDKGVIYITFHKASEAALAQEEMNGRLMDGYPKPLKVLIANDRKEGSVREPKEGEKMLRIFIKIPKHYADKDVEDKFRDFGDIDYVNVLRDKTTGDSKGLAYVKYHRAYHAALALENCDPTFRAMFAARKQSKYDNQGPMSGDFELGPVGSSDRYSGEQGYYGGSDRGGSGGGGSGGSGGLGSGMGRGGPMDMVRDYGGGGGRGAMSGETRLEVMASSAASQEQLYRLFDLIPGLEFCDFDRHSGVAYVRYVNPQCASYAREKLHGFEYPPGYRISVRYPGSDVPMRDNSRDYYASRGNGTNDGSAAELNQSMQNMMAGGNVQDNLQSLVESIKKATSVLQAAGLGESVGGSMGSDSGRSEIWVKYCNVPLPEKQPFAPRDSQVAERLFIVSKPDPFPENILTDSFCRFGSLIDAFFMPGKNYGYAKFASKESAKKAMDVLHGQQICGNRLKVLLADPPKYNDDYESSSKKPKT